MAEIEVRRATTNALLRLRPDWLILKANISYEVEEKINNATDIGKTDTRVPRQGCGRGREETQNFLASTLRAPFNLYRACPHLRLIAPFGLGSFTFSKDDYIPLRRKVIIVD